ncbi:MAG: hypothetical protein ACLTV6_06870 [Christensenellales bacterium]
MKVQDATKELSRRAAKLLGDVTGVRTAAEKTLAELRKIENGFTQQQEAEREEKRREEQQKALSSQSKAWTMPDDVPVEKTEERRKSRSLPPNSRKRSLPLLRPLRPSSAERQRAAPLGRQLCPRRSPRGAPRAQGQQFCAARRPSAGRYFARVAIVPRAAALPARGSPQGGNFAPRGDRPRAVLARATASRAARARQAAWADSVRWAAVRSAPRRARS